VSQAAGGLVDVATLTYRRPDDLVQAAPAFLAGLGTVERPGGLLVVEPISRPGRPPGTGARRGRQVTYSPGGADQRLGDGRHD